MNLDPDDPVYRRRALAAHVTTLSVRVELAVAGAVELEAPVPPAIIDMAPELRRWAAAIERGPARD